jgi:hypothetical protein
MRMASWSAAGNPIADPALDLPRRMKRPLRIASASNAMDLQEELVGAPHFLTGVALVQQCGGTLSGWPIDSTAAEKRAIGHDNP